MKLKSIMKPMAPTVEAGSYLAVCVGVVFIGEQYIPPFGDKKGRYENRLMFVWDIPSELDENGTPKQLSKAINATSSAKGNLMVILSGWNSRTYTKEELADTEVNDQLGKPCMLSVGVNENGYVNVTAVSAIPKGIPAPVSNTPFIKFDVNEWSDEGFAALPEWVQNRIKESTEYQKLHVPTDPVDVDTSGGQQAGAADSGQAQKEENPI
ncbi:hypothetical protein [Anaerotruncus sp. 1XD42-93]|uniref:phage replication initiation protein, NGO0469 family n=1 Tax=Anaerotruncus sp. 1XD42-93 TaxID=2320853 RepID=UPI0013146FFF|nr:hypothetical protein [Anaerotruncus sp. 1XD42-93]